MSTDSKPYKTSWFSIAAIGSMALIGTGIIGFLHPTLFEPKSYTESRSTGQEINQTRGCNRGRPNLRRVGIRPNHLEKMTSGKEIEIVLAERQLCIRKEMQVGAQVVESAKPAHRDQQENLPQVQVTAIRSVPFTQLDRSKREFLMKRLEKNRKTLRRQKFLVLRIKKIESSSQTL